MRNFKIDGIIIKRKDIGESDRLLTVFTKELGKITIKASGIRRIASRRSPHVELLNNSILGLYKGSGFPVLIEAQTIENYDMIKNDLQKTGFAYHICELVEGLCPENQENRRVFFLLKDTLSRLTIEEDIVSIIHEFEVELLTLLGYWDKEQQAFQKADMHNFIENILERKLRSKNFFLKLQS